MIFLEQDFFQGFFCIFKLKIKILEKENLVSHLVFSEESESGVRFEKKNDCEILVLLRVNHFSGTI